MYRNGGLATVSFREHLTCSADAHSVRHAGTLYTRLIAKDSNYKMFPLQGERAHSLYFLYVRTLGFKNNRKEKEETEQQTYQFTARL